MKQQLIDRIEKTIGMVACDGSKAGVAVKELEYLLEEVEAEVRREEDERIKNWKNELLGWAGFWRGRGLDEKAMPRFHNLIDSLTLPEKERESK